MADCSKTEVFFGELDRMCDCFADECELCPFDKHLVGEFACDSFIRECPEKAITIVQKWSDEHPIPKPKTYADDFFEKFPNAIKDSDGAPPCCREVVYGQKYHNLCTKPESCEECWNKPYPEQEEAV